MAAPLLDLPPEIWWASLSAFFGAAQPIGRLATASSSVATDLKDSSGSLRVGAITTGRLSSALEGLQRVSLGELKVFRLDLSGERHGLVSKQELEHAIRQLGQNLSKAAALQVLAVRLSCFDETMERLSLGANAWEALIRCLGELAEYGRLRSLELSSINIKNSRVTQDVSMRVASSDLPLSARTEEKAPRQLRRAATETTRGSGAAAAAACTSRNLSFLDVLERLSSLEELALTYDEIFGNTAQMLPPVFHKMSRLKRVDLTRNHIPKQVMQEVRAAMPKKVELSGDELQTFYFY